jgi:hypothetical protein
MPQLKSPPFACEVNLDCPNDLEQFLKTYEPARGRVLANRLEFVGKGSAKAANALMNYAQNKRTAIACRKFGKIPSALRYEEICDRIYREDIQPLIKCW